MKYSPALRSRYESCRELCANLDNPGLGTGIASYMDYSDRRTSRDQSRIERELEKMNLVDKTLLHVGIGNSSLALALAPRARWIDGLTMTPREKALADSLEISNYRVLMLNKHGREFILAINRGEYDFVVDNNLSSFACCKYHFYRMFDNYLWCLKPNGQIITDQDGMNWACLDPRFTLDYDDLTALEEKFSVKVSKLTDMVYTIQAINRAAEDTKLSGSYRRCERDGRVVVEFRPALKPDVTLNEKES